MSLGEILRNSNFVHILTIKRWKEKPPATSSRGMRHIYRSPVIQQRSKLSSLFIHQNAFHLRPGNCSWLVMFRCRCKHALWRLLLHKHHSFTCRNIRAPTAVLYYWIERERKTAGGWRLIFKRFRWIPAPALHTEGKSRISRRTWPADPVASTPPSIPYHHLPTHHISQPNLAFFPHSLVCTQTLQLHALFIFYNMDIK